MSAAATRLLPETGLYLASRAAPAGAALACVALLFRLMPLAEYGRYALLSALALFSGTVACSWLTQAMLRYQSASGDRLTAYLGSVRRGAGTSAFAAAAATYAAALGWLHADVRSALSAAALAATTAVYTAALAYGQAGLRPRDVARSEISRALLTVLPVAALYWQGEPAPAFVLLLFAASANVLALASGGGWRLLAHASAPPDPAILRQLWSFGLPVAAWAGAASFLNTADRFIIGWLLGPEQVAQYAAAYDIVFRSMSLLLSPLLLAAHPMITSAWNRGRAGEASALIRTAAFYQAALSCAVLAVLLWGSGFVTDAAPGLSADAVRLVVPVALGAALWQLAMVVHKPLELSGRTGLMLLFITVTAALNVAANTLLVPLFGAVAAAYTTAACAALYLSLVLFAHLLTSHTYGIAGVGALDAAGRSKLAQA